MPDFIEKLEMLTLPTLPLRGIVAFPGVPLSIELSVESDIKAAEYADSCGSNIFLCALEKVSIEEIDPADLYSVGTVCSIKQFLKLPEGNARLILEGLSRASVLKIDKVEDILYADVMSKFVSVSASSTKAQALMREVFHQYEEFIGYIPKASNELDIAVKSIKDPSLYADFIAFNLLVNYSDKQEILSEYDPIKRLELLCVLMGRELRVLSTEMNIHKTVRARIERNQREYYLREQLKVIQDELGDQAEEDSEIDEYDEAIYKANLPEEVKEKLIKEVRKLAKTPYTSAEAAVIRNYLDICLEIPWTKVTEDRIDLPKARKILNADHDGLEKIKERMLEFLAVQKLNKNAGNQIICLVGPPGTGKTSICESIARAMNRKYVRICLGGVRDEADIRGHRKTYIASMPGRIVSAISQAGVRNPLILLDEIDKLTNDSHGDPSSALLEVLDGEQNSRFRDHFVEMPIDLSDCIFIATANTLAGIPEPLADRMEIIELDIYNRYQKLTIAKRHLIKKQRTANGLTAKDISIADSAILEIIDNYTAEAGVRSLNREIGSLCRKVAAKKVEFDPGKITINKSNLHEYLGQPKIIQDKISDIDEIGAVNGLAYTSLGGDILKIEVSAMSGDGKLELTGSLGDVMKESARAAVTYIRAHAKELGVPEDFYRTTDIHIHVPEGAVPKDGPSAGITILTALVSELSKTPVKRDVAMTGEITLRGTIIPIGGLKEKTMAAFKAGVKKVIIPENNRKDICELDATVKEGIEIIPCKNVAQALDVSLVR
ncbi:MAG: endopeptidase La [Clostridia bacterium]|nr:endopeptidase La [Clostridia bacterium]